MRKILFIFLGFCFQLAMAQPNDCANAITVCGNGIFSSNAEGIGNNQEITSCGSSEHNSIWLKIIIDASSPANATLGFNLIPNDPDLEVDYDFWVFAANATCTNLGSPIRCNTSNPGLSGATNNITGTDNSTVVTQSGPGAGIPFVRWLTNVQPGSTYYLAIDRPHGDGGFEIEWTGTAVFPELPDANEIGEIRQCSTTDSALFDLNAVKSAINPDLTNNTITFFTSFANAIDNTGALPGIYVNTSNPQEIFAKVTNTATGCFTITSFDLKVFPVPDASLSVSETEVCGTEESVQVTLSGTPGAVVNYSVNGELQTIEIDASGEYVFTQAITQNTTVTLVNAQILGWNNLPVCNTTLSESVVINVIEIPSPLIEITQPDCDTAEGSISIISPVGTEYQYSINGTVYQDSPMFENLASGTYQLTVANGDCISDALEVIIQNQPTTPDAPTVSVIQPGCGIEAVIEITAPLGSQYQYSIDGNNYQNSPVFENLSSGTYEVFVSNSGCISQGVQVAINDYPIIPSLPEAEIIHPDCDIAFGSINITFPLGTEYEYSIDNGVSYHTNPVFENLVSGAYQVKVSNGECTSDTLEVVIENQPEMPEVFVLDPLFVCNGENTAPFMLTDRTAAASGGVTGTTITYYETITDAENNTNALSSPYMGTHNQIVVVKAQSQYGCVSYMTLTLMITDAPVDPILDPLEYCDLNSDGIGIFDLTTVIPIIETANSSPTVISFHGTYDDAFYDANNLTINNDITAFVNTEWYNQTIYIRIEGVTECFTIAELELIVHDLPQITDPEPFEMCDDDYDGFVEFDLSSINEEVLGTLNPLTHEVSYFTTESDAHNNTNEIGNITTYTNQIIHEDTVWVRVDDQETGCYDLAELTLIVNPLPVVAMPEVPEYRLCDEDGDGYVEFDLQTQIAGIINGQAGLDVTFHDTYEDAELDQNPYPYLHTNNQPFVEAVFVRVETEKGCFVITLLDLIADPLPTLTMPIDPVISCDGDGDGYGVINLEELIEDMLNGADPTEFEVNFYETYLNAEEAQNALLNPEAYFNSNPFTQIIYVRVDNLVSGCFTIYPLTLTVETAPEIPVDANNELPEIELCDDNFDGITYFDFTEQTNYIMAAQTDITNLMVTYHQTQEDAENGTLAIATPDHYQNITTPQIIWVRLENTETECFDTASFEIIVNIPLEIPENLQLTVCDGDSDGIVEFDLTGMNPTILSNASNPNNYQVDFFLTLQDAQTDTNIIENPTTFSNQQLGGGGVYTIYVRVIDLVTGCESYRSLTIRRAPMPNPLTTNIVPLELCDAITEDDMMEEFDLTSYEDYIRNGDVNLIFTYHLSEEEAQNNENAITTPEAYFTGSTTIYIRISNQPNDSQNCTVVIELELIVNPLPTVAQNYYAICNENSTGFEAFDLNNFTPTLLGPTQNPDDFLVEYYLTLADAENQTNPINQGVPFENTTEDSQTIYVHIYNEITECERIAEFTLYAEEAAVAHPVADIEVCDYFGDNDGITQVDLVGEWESTVLGSQSPVQFAVTYHLSQEDAENNTNAIPNPTTYSNVDSPYSQTIYIRVENTDTLSPCYDIAVAQLLVEPLAEPVITSNFTHLCVNADGSIGRTVELNSNITDPNYTFEWFHNGVSIPGETQSTYTIDQFGGEGEYYVIATSTNPYFECESEPSDTITIGLSGSATIVYIESTNAFENQQDIIVTVTGYGEYLYQLDNGPLQNTGHFVNVSPGAHTVTVYDVLPGDGDIDNENNCDAIPVENVSVVNYPHYFTPNGDGYHDRWNITGLNAFHNAEIYIFDRYGKLLKQLNPTGDGWDGTFNGTPLPASDYWFKVVYDEPVTDSEGITTTRRKEFKAHFSIKR